MSESSHQMVLDTSSLPQEQAERAPGARKKLKPKFKKGEGIIPGRKTRGAGEDTKASVRPRRVLPLSRPLDGKDPSHSHPPEGLGLTLV